MKKFQAVVREFTRFSVVSTVVEYFFLVWNFLWLTLLLQQMANRSYLKSQKLKATEADRQKIALLEAENAALKKDKAVLEQRVRMLKEVIQKNRGNLLICVLRLFFLVILVLTSFLLWLQMVLESTRRSYRSFEWRLKLWSSP